MTFLAFSRLNSDRTSGFNVTRPERNLSAAVHVPMVLDKNQYLSTSALTSSIEAFSEKAGDMMKPHSESGWKDVAADKLKPVMTEAKALQKAAIARAKELDKRKGEYLKSDMNPAHSAELRAYLREQKPGDVIRRTASDGALALAALDNPFGIPGLDDPQLLKEVERAAMLYSMGKAYSGESYDTHKVPSIDDPLAYGVDSEKLKDVAKEALANYEASLADLGFVRNVIRQTVQYVSVVADMRPEEAFEVMGLAQ